MQLGLRLSCMGWCRWCLQLGGPAAAAVLAHGGCNSCRGLFKSQIQFVCQQAQPAQLASPALLAQLQPARVTCMWPHWCVMHGQACVACAVESNNVMFVCAHVPQGMPERGLPREDPRTNSWGLGAPGPRGAPLAVEEQP